MKTAYLHGRSSASQLIALICIHVTICGHLSPVKLNIKSSNFNCFLNITAAAMYSSTHKSSNSQCWETAMLCHLQKRPCGGIIARGSIYFFTAPKIEGILNSSALGGGFNPKHFIILWVCVYNWADPEVGRPRWEPVPLSTSWSRAKNHKKHDTKSETATDSENVRPTTIKHPVSESGCWYTTPHVHPEGLITFWPQNNWVDSSHTNVNLLPKLRSKGGLI